MIYINGQTMLHACAISSTQEDRFGIKLDTYLKDDIPFLQMSPTIRAL